MRSSVGSGGAAVAASSAGPGTGSKEALAQSSCDAKTGRIKFQFYGAPPCVRPWSDGDDNGGATAQGVTADSIKVVVLIPPADKDRASTNGGIKNQATGANGLSTDAVLDENAVLAHSYQTWGRTIEYEFVEAERHRRDRAARRRGERHREEAVRGVGHRALRERRWRARVRAGGQDERHARLPERHVADRPAQALRGEHGRVGGQAARAGARPSSAATR